ncbi:amidohydrolase [Guggenheimella bovis]
MRTAFINGKIYVERDHFEEALLVDGEHIALVGTTEEVKKEAADRVIDLEGRTVIPGLHDSHEHLLNIGKMLSILRLGDVRSIDELIKVSKKFIEENPEVKEAGLYGRGWNQDYFTDKRMPSKEDLNEISREIPIVFTRACGHISVANDKALEMRGVDETTVVEGGNFEKDANGKLTGICQENADGYIREIFPEPSYEEQKSRFLKAMDYVSRQGLTAVQCNDTYENNWPVLVRALKEIEREGNMKVRYGHQFNFEHPDKLKAFLEEEAKGHKNEYTDMHYLSALKLYKDGSLGARTALMRKPYHDDPSTKGVETITDDRMIELGNIAKEYGFRTVVHVIGDGAVKQTIDVLKTVGPEGNPNRSGLIHEQITDVELLKEVVAANLTVYYQPIFLHYDLHITADRVGDELASTSYAFKTQQDLGAHTSYGTDAPIEDSNPFANIYCAVTRKDMSGFPEGGWYPNECVDVQRAIDNYTLESAYMVQMEDRLGRLKKGYLADLVVLDRDIFTVSSDEIKDITPVLTMVNGTISYERN